MFMRPPDCCEHSNFNFLLAPMSKIMTMMMRHRPQNTTTPHHPVLGDAGQCCDVVEDVESPKQPTSAAPFLPLSRFASASPLMSSPPHVLCSIRGVVVHYSGARGGHQLQWWRNKAEDCLWLASAIFILYYGDFRSDFFTLLAYDARVLRTPLHMGLVFFMLDVCMVMLYIAMMGDDHMQHPCLDTQETHFALKTSDHSAMAAQALGENIQVAMLVIGSSAYILMCVALWPIWKFLTMPMLFTLFMATTVVAPYLAPTCSRVKLDHGDRSSNYGLGTHEHRKI